MNIARRKIGKIKSNDDICVSRDGIESKLYINMVRDGRESLH